MNTKSIILIKTIGVALIALSLYVIFVTGTDYLYAWQRTLVIGSIIVMFMGIIMLFFTKSIIKNISFGVMLIILNLVGLFAGSNYFLVWRKGLPEIIGSHIFLIIGIIILIQNKKWKDKKRMEEINELMNMYSENKN